jgi:hypothetical protein
MTFDLIASYALFSLFVFYQQLHVKTFRGASQIFGTELTLFTFVAMLAGLVFLLYYGYKVSWLGALGLFCVALVVKFLWFGIEARLGLRAAAPSFSMVGFIGIPLCTHFMWAALPR